MLKFLTDDLSVVKEERFVNSLVRNIVRKYAEEKE